MLERVERNNRTFEFAGALATIMCLAMPAAPRAEDLSSLSRRLTSHHGLSVDQLSDLLAIGTPADNGERRLVRWEQDEITLGIVASYGVTADMIDKTIAPIENAFRDVDRRLHICIRWWDQEVSAIDDSRIFPDCQSQPIEIDLVLDASAHSMFTDINAPQLPSDSRSDFLRGLWSKMRNAVLAHPTEYFCSAGLGTDMAAQKVVGGAGLIRPKPEQNALLTMTLCAREIAYGLLGAIPIADQDGKGGYLDGDLLKLLYGAEFRSGETRTEVLEKLRAASDN